MSPFPLRILRPFAFLLTVVSLFSETAPAVAQVATGSIVGTTCQ